MAGLIKSQIAKRNNFTIFKNRILNRKPFTLVGGGEIKVGFLDAKMHKAFTDQLKNINSLDAYSKGGIPVYNGTQQSNMPLGSLYKDSEFSGRSQAGTAKEDIELERLKSLIQKAKDSEGTDTITVMAGTQRIPNVFDAETTKGTPKSDFHLVDEAGREICWISHKDGADAKAFGQWGGITDAAGISISKHPEVLKFVEDMKMLYGEQMPRATTVGREIQDDTLKHRAVYGPDFGRLKGKDNVNILLQGEVTLRKNGQNYVLSSVGPSHSNGDNLIGAYEPVLMIIYKGDRAQFGIQGARFSIYPKGGRRISQFV